MRSADETTVSVLIKLNLLCFRTDTNINMWIAVLYHSSVVRIAISNGFMLFMTTIHFTYTSMF